MVMNPCPANWLRDKVLIQVAALYEFTAILKLITTFYYRIKILRLG